MWGWMLHICFTAPIFPLQGDYNRPRRPFWNSGGWPGVFLNIYAELGKQTITNFVIMFLNSTSRFQHKKKDIADYQRKKYGKLSCLTSICIKLPKFCSLYCIFYDIFNKIPMFPSCLSFYKESNQVYLYHASLTEFKFSHQGQWQKFLSSHFLLHFQLVI